MQDFLFLQFTTKNKNTIIMGRGDKKTAKGKRFKGSFGNSRPANALKKAIAKKAEAVNAAKAS